MFADIVSAVPVVPHIHSISLYHTLGQTKVRKSCVQNACRPRRSVKVSLLLVRYKSVAPQFFDLKIPTVTRVGFFDAELWTTLDIVLQQLAAFVDRRLREVPEAGLGIRG